MHYKKIQSKIIQNKIIQIKLLRNKLLSKENATKLIHQNIAGHMEPVRTAVKIAEIDGH